MGYLWMFSSIMSTSTFFAASTRLYSEKTCVLELTRGVDNGAAGAAAAAPIIWLVVVIQKWRAFRRPTHILPCTFSKRLRRSARTWSQRISQKYCHKHGLRVWQSPVDYFTVCAMIALMISVIIAAIITRLSWCLFNPCCSSIVIGKTLFCFVTGN